MKSMAFTATSLSMAASGRAHLAISEVLDGRADNWLEQVTELHCFSAS